MLVWFLVLVSALACFVLVHRAIFINRQKRLGFTRRATQATTSAEAAVALTRKKPDWVVQEVLRLKALMGKSAGCRKVADTFNRLHAPTRTIPTSSRPPRKLVRQKWLGGLHSSYRWAA